MSYFIIGYEHFERVSEQELIKRINDEYYGENSCFLNEMPDNENPAYWGEGVYLIIKGDQVSPHPIEKVTEWAIE